MKALLVLIQALLLAAVAVVIACAFFGWAPAHAGGVVDVAKCTIDANDHIPYGKQLDAAVKKCYELIPEPARTHIYATRHHYSEPNRVVIEVRCGPRSVYHATLVPTLCK